MEYQKLINLLDNTPHQSSKFRTKNWTEINNDLRGMYSLNSQINFKISMLKSRLCDYSDAYSPAKGTITDPNATATGAAVDNAYKKVVIKNCTPFTDCISEINTTQTDSAKDTDVVILMNKLIEYSDNYSKTSGSLWQDYRDERFLDNNVCIADFPAGNNNSASLKLNKKQQVKQEMMKEKTMKYRNDTITLSKQFLENS